MSTAKQSQDTDQNFKLTRNKSFSKKNNQIRIKQTGEEQRPNIPRTQSGENMSDRIYDLMENYLPKDVENIQKQIVNHVEYTLARTRFDFKSIHCYQAAAHSVRDRLIEYFNDTNRCLKYSGKKKVYYLSIQFLIGRCFQNALVNLDLEKTYADALRDLGYQYERIREKEIDPALGNGGLGRLAACFLDSLATLNYPAWGYGIRYDYGIFKQMIKNGYQVQVPDFWLSEGNPWEIQRIDVQYRIKFYGKTRKVVDPMGRQRVLWQQYETIMARAYDTPIPGYATFNTIGLRLWRSLPVNQFDFARFNMGQYEKALQARQKAEYITSVLYPNDSNQQGKQLRLKQQYLLVSATMQDIIRRHKSNAKLNGQKFDWRKFPKQAAIQLNDTHPSLAIVEFLRILLDEEGVDRETAWQIVYDTFSYTNHTVLPQALEKWDVLLMEKLLPRHLELIYLINFYWLGKIGKKLSEEKDEKKMKSLSIVEQSVPKRIRMAHLCIVGSHKVNGVAHLHSQLLKKTLFKDFYDITPNKFINVTNGVTFRRWIACANPLLAQFYTRHLHTDQWLTNMDLLRGLQKYVQDPEFQSKWTAIKHINKRKLVDWVKKTLNLDINEDALFDVQIKRIHEYKRQFMNILYCIYRYLKIKSMTPEQRALVVPRTVMFGGKAAPGYDVAKKIIKLINEVSFVVNNDQVTKNLLKVVYIPNYNVSIAQLVIPATQLSQHISLAGTQASGTSNMKFVLNGGLIIGTMDGANVQIYEEVGKQNIFIFGARVEQVDQLKHRMSITAPEKYLPASLQPVFQAIRQGKFGDRQPLLSLISTINSNNDWYLVGADFQSYIKCQEQVDRCYLDQKTWTKMSILNAIRSGKFSSDRSIREYATKIWNIEPCKVLQSMLKSTPKQQAEYEYVRDDRKSQIIGEGNNQ